MIPRPGLLAPSMILAAASALAAGALQPKICWTDEVPKRWNWKRRRQFKILGGQLLHAGK